MAKQMPVPGTEDPVIEEIQEAGDRLLKVRNRRKKLNAEEHAANESLVEVMKKHRKTRHTLADGFVVTLEKVERAKIKEPKPEKKKKAEAEADE